MGAVILHFSIFIGLVILVILLVIGWGALRFHRKGDFAFRIKKLQKRTSELISKVMDFENESDYFSLYEKAEEKRLIKEVEAEMGEVNEMAVDVSEHLGALLKRSNSLFDFSDLYVDIGIQEEKLEKAEATYQVASAKLQKLPKI